jgi:hypothetical protein
VGDWGYEGDSGYLAHLRGDTNGNFGGDVEGAASRDRWNASRWNSDRADDDRWNSDRWDDHGDADRWDPDRWDADRRDPDRREPSLSARVPPEREPSPPARVPPDDAAVGVARRLLGRLEQHVRLLEKLQAEHIYPEPPGLAELQDTARRMHHDAANILLLCGDEPEPADAVPRPLGELLTDVAVGAEASWRVEVLPAPVAVVAPGAAVELLHVLAEVVDHATAAYPGARLELASRLDEGIDGPPDRPAPAADRPPDVRFRRRRDRALPGRRGHRQEASTRADAACTFARGGAVARAAAHHRAVARASVRRRAAT